MLVECFYLEKLIFILAALLHSGLAFPDVIKIGGLFEDGDEVLEMAFKSAVEKINNDRKVLPRTTLVAKIERIQRGDSFRASKIVCGLIEQEVVAIVGPQSIETGTHIQSICEALNIPHIEARLDYRVNSPRSSLNLYPPPSVLGEAVKSLIKSKKWRKFAVIYKDNDGLLRLEELVKSSDLRQRRIFVRQFKSEDYRVVFKDLSRSQIKNVVVDAPAEAVFDILNHARSVNMLSEYHDYIFTTLDLQNTDLVEFVSAGTNISSFSLVDRFSDSYLDFIKGFQSTPISAHQILLETDRVIPEQLLLQNFTTEAALIHDTVELLAKALHDLARNYQFKTPKVKCERDEPWPFGANLTNYMRKLKISGITGNIEFNRDFQRTDVKLDIYQLKYEGLKLVGNWTVENGTIFMSNYSEAMLEKTKKTLENKTLTVSTILSRPYVMLKPECEFENVTEITNDCYDGFCVDLIKNLAESLGFKYEIKIVRDKAYGEPDEQGEWNGMIGELIDGKADIAVADLTINHEREKAVDFTMPFMNLGIGILFKKMKKEPPSLFSFMAPLAIEVWLYLLTAFLAITLAQFLVARFSPYEWMNPHPCIKNPHELENNFTIKNTLWFTIGCLMQQGCYVMPRALSTRVLAASWWFFILILVSSYTANLAAFLTNERMSDPIESVEALAKQTKIHYGCLASGSTKKFFKNSSFSVYARMWSFMETARPSVFVESNAKGVERVKRGNYALLMESTSIEYVVERECDLYQVGSLLDNKGYGIATQPGSPYRKPLSETITKLQENGTLYKLKEKWWNEKKCPKEGANKAAGAASELGLANVGGVFMVLASGAFMSCLMAVAEFCWKMKQIPRDERDHIFVELMRELKNVTCCYGRARPVRRIAVDCNGRVVVTTGGEVTYPPMPILRYGYPHPLHPVPQHEMMPDIGTSYEDSYLWRRKMN